MVIHSRQSRTERYIRKKCAIRAPEAILFRPRNYKRSGEVKKSQPRCFGFFGAFVVFTVVVCLFTFSYARLR